MYRLHPDRLLFTVINGCLPAHPPPLCGFCPGPYIHGTATVESVIADRDVVTINQRMRTVYWGRLTPTRRTTAL